MPLAPSTRTRLTLLALWLVLYSTFTLLVPPLLDDADSVHAEVAREMIQRHDWVTLYANGIRYLEKAPILYWSMALSFKLFGVSTAAARLPLALTVLALALFLEAFARRAFASARAGLYAGLITLSSFGIFIFTRITIPDADVCLWLTLALLAFWTTEQSPAHAGTTGAPSFAPFAKVGVSSAARPPSLPTPESPTASPALPHGPIPRLPCFLFAAACALNVLTKGLIGIVFPIGIVALYLLITRGPAGALRRIRQLHPLTSILVFLALAAPWHILIGLANPTQGHPAPITHLNGAWQVPLPTDGNVHGWFWFYFVNEHILRYLNLRVPRDYDTVPLALFWGLILIWLMPWSTFLFHAITRVPLLKALRQIPWKTPQHETRHSMADVPRHPTAAQSPPLTPLQRTNLLLGLWAAVPLLFFSLSTRQEYYVLPALPALILLIASWLADASLWNNTAEVSPAPNAATTVPTFTLGETDVTRADRAGASATTLANWLVPIGTLAAAACVVFLLKTRTPSPNTGLASLLQQNPGDYALSFGHFLDLNAQALGLFRLPLALTAAALCLGSLAHFHLRRRGRPHAATLALAAAAVVFLIAAHLGLQTFAPVLSSEKLAEAIRPQLHPADLIVLHGEYESGSTLGFYLRRDNLHILEGRSSNLWYGSFFPDAPKIFETRESIAQKWSGPQRIFLWQDPSDRDRPPLNLTPSFVIAQSGGKQILSNQPNP